MEHKDLVDMVDRFIDLRDAILARVREIEISEGNVSREWGPFPRNQGCPGRFLTEGRPCPPHDYGPLDHYSVSCMLAGMGRLSWNCPLCGEGDSM